jgi:hypothetical protein|tara:strand:+ start:7077 stop:7364 length:288 start_codon:yes stop_codon:yes gene_type:complete
MQAINSIYTKKIQRLYKLDRQYSDLVDAHQRVWDVEDEDSNYGYRLRGKQERAESKLFDRMDAIAEELPKRECLNFDKQYKLVHGYTSTAVCYHI